MKRRLATGLAGALLCTTALLAAFGPAVAQEEIVIAQANDALTMDPAKHSAFPTANIMFQLYDALVTMDGAGQFQPALATEWSNPEPTTWRFKLREGVTFHNGEPFNAAAVKFSFDRALDPAFQAPYRSRIAAIQSVEIVDDMTVDFKTAAPFPTMLFSLYEASFAALIVPPGYIEANGPEALVNAPVGTGPYKFVEWLKDERVVLEANPDYWGGAPEIERVTFRPIKEVRTRIAELTSGGVDLIVDVPPEDVASLDQGDTKIVTKGSDFIYFYAFDTLKESPLQNKLVRQAINYAVDVAAIQEALLGGLGTRVALTLPTDAFAYDASWEPYPYDPAKAKELLAEAGYPDGFTIPLTSRQGRYLKDREIMEATIGFLAEVGITVEPNYLEPGVWATVSEAKGREGIIFPGWSGRDPDLVWYPLLYTGQYQSYYSNPELDALLDAGRKTIDAEERKAIYAQAGAIIKEEAPHLPMLQPPLIYAVDATLSWEPRTDSIINLRGASFE
ncbi:peptide/nickel transport system substrate-binding protein [Devosia enhydra]|uniref:Peptide/nickel transport system substrate-binding protein n=1 Tax=Devosia enhydra TaxID=665118 RepID=A0A1K2HS11_9HYPH|nr:ABC transporter substrate-binding protein [Devosia enhydra]SFZ80595.1 peptide/nickel transport system substrate-binding protein [Devosia enhydra]